MTNTPAPTTPDWTADASGRSNSSPLFEAMIEEVARLIRQEAHFLLQGDTESVARLIMAQLAHKHGLGPARSTPAEPLDVTSDAFRDALSSAMQDHICDDRTGWPHPRGNVLDPTAAAEMLDGCDDLCADDIADRLAARLRSPEGDR